MREHDMSGLGIWERVFVFCLMSVIVCGWSIVFVVAILFAIIVSR